jgi:transcriptional regulator of acetoin/glycerol metabolism
VHPPTAHRGPIAASWRRAQLAGLEPTSALARVRYDDVDRGGSLLDAAGPVLHELDARLEGTRFATVLVDREARVLHRGCGDRSAQGALDALGVDLGASLLEEAIGTNAPGTALEIRRSIVIHGGEHFAEPLRRFSCYGHPIFHPTTRRLEGALDLTTLAEEANPLLGPLVARAVADIEQRLLERGGASDRRLMSAFRAESGRRRSLVAIGHDVFMANQGALDLLGPSDLSLLRMLADETDDGDVVEVHLESGSTLRVHASRADGRNGGALLRLDPQVVPRPREPRVPHPTYSPLLVSGPPGSGRTTRAVARATAAPVTTLTAAEALVEGLQAWSRTFAAAVRSGEGTVIVDGVELLPDQLVDLVSAHAAARRAPRLVLVSGPVDHVTGRVAALVGACTEHDEVPPLAARLQELPALVSQMLDELGADSSLHLTPGCLRALAAQPWRGNLRELRAVIEHVVRHRSTGGVVVADLPESHRTPEASRVLAPIEAAERHAIVAALRKHGGNKVRTAAELRISRTTLYAKMRALRISTAP